MAKLTIELSSKEIEALQRLARTERRNSRAQAGIIVRRELARAGLLPAEPMSADMPAERGQLQAAPDAPPDREKLLIALLDALAEYGRAINMPA